MTATLQQAKQIVREEGVVSLSRKAGRLLKTQKVRLVDDRYWDWRGGTQELFIGSVSARFDAHSEAGGDIVRWSHLNERNVLRQLVDELSEDDVFLDVGANVGFFTCFASNVLSEGKVIAVEPFPPNVEQLRRNVSYNSPENVDIEQVALAESSGSVQFTDHDQISPTAAFDSGSDTITVEQHAADDLIGGEFPAPTIVKIDVEGAEPSVIEGMSAGLSDPRCRTCFCEIHLPQPGRPSIEDYGYTAAEVVDLLEDCGFSITSEERRGNEVHLRADK